MVLLSQLWTNNIKESTPVNLSTELTAV